MKNKGIMTMDLNSKIRKNLDRIEKGDEYSVATDTVRCWLDEEERHDSQEPALPMLGIDSTISQTGGRVEYNNMGYNGFSKREYAAIKLRVPDSGKKWLDDMIRRANRREIANRVMQGVLVDPQNSLIPLVIRDCYEFADEMLKQEVENEK